MEDSVGNAALRGGASNKLTLDDLFTAVEQEWQDQALCAQTDPEAFFLRRVVRPGRLSVSARRALSVMSVWSLPSSMMSALVFGVVFRTANAAA